MAEYQRIPEYNVNVIVTTMAEELNTITNEKEFLCTKKLFLCSGGGLCMLLNEEMLECLYSVLPVSERSLVRGVLKPGPTVILLEDFFVNHSEEEIKAVLFHEIGHAVNRDCYVAAVSSNSSYSVLLDQDRELKADQFAAKKTSKSAMKNALVKCLTKQAELISAAVTGRSGRDAQTLLNELLSDNGVKQRLEALS